MEHAEGKAEDYGRILAQEEKLAAEYMEMEGFRLVASSTYENGDAVEIWTKKFGESGMIAGEVRRITPAGGGKPFCIVYAHGVPLTGEELQLAEEEAFPWMVKWRKAFRASCLWEAVGIARLMEQSLCNPLFDRIAFSHLLVRLQKQEE